MRIRLALGVAVLLLAGGCASIPTETAPQQADLQGGKVSPGIADPPRNEDPLSIVRGFIDHNGDPTDQHAEARGYLADDAQRTWNLGSAPTGVLIIDDTFSTVFGDEPKADANLDDVQLGGTLIGTVDTDGAFTPATPQQAAFQLSFQVRRGKDGQWRILNPPNELVVGQADFDSHYRQVPIYFFDPSWSVLVPDERYVVSDPVGQPARIVQLLLDGPSVSLRGAVQDAIPPEASLKTNVTVQPDGLIYINFKGLTDLPSNTKQLMIAQILGSLQNTPGGTVAIDAENLPLVSGHPTWRLADLPLYAPYVGPNATGGLVVAHGRIYNLNSGAPIAGPAGNGDYDVLTAAQSLDGAELATVTVSSTGDEELRIGGLKNSESPVNDLTGKSFTRPTWEPGDAAGDPSRAVWTVVDGAVYRVQHTAQGNWAPSPVEASALQSYGPITDLRLSPDGVRVAVAAGGHLLVGTVVADQGSVAIKQVQLIRNPALAGVTHVDWNGQELMVVATNKSTAPVQSVSIDGERIETYSQANLTSQVTALAAGPNGLVLVADQAGIWSTTDVSEVWRLIPHRQPPDAIPFYPG